MFSLGSHLSLNNPSMVHSLVDSFFEGKKALVKERLMDSVRVIVDGLFEEMVGQVKEMLLPPKSAVNDQVKANAASNTTPEKPSIIKPPMKSVPPSQLPKNKLIFATKSKPGLSSSAVSQPFSGLYKRMAEGDGVSISSSNSQPNKKKAMVSIVELQIDGPLDDEDDYGDVAINDIEQLDKDTAHKNISNGLKQQQPKQTAEKKVACPEPGCGKLLTSGNLKPHLRTHTNAKPFACNYSGCSLEFNQRGNALRHILKVHFKKKNGKKEKPNEDADEEDGNDDESANPAAYLSVKKELL